jgi:hypothetical protein
MGVTLLRGFLGGIPVFGQGADFTKAMKGQGSGLVGTMLKTMIGLEPVQFKSDTEVNRVLTAESKVFSIYSTGEIPGYQRKTRIRLHTVVDFRGAPAPGVGTAQPNTTNPPNRPATPPPTGTVNTVGSSSADPLSGALAPNPGGTIVYYRME